ncbi:RHOMBOID-like protein 8 [Linum perenne]
MLSPEESPKWEAKIEIAYPPPPPSPPLPTSTSLPLELTADDVVTSVQKTPFFRSRYRQKRSDTWIISAFVITYIVVFISTMFVNDCRRNSGGDCAAKGLSRMSFQHLNENPFLGPSSSTLDKMGALRRTLLEKHQTWRILSSPLLHAGVFHLIINLICILFVGIFLEQEYGAVRTGLIYTGSAVFGTLVGALFVQDNPAVTSSSALHGLVGAAISALTKNWKFYTSKVRSSSHPLCLHLVQTLAAFSSLNGRFGFRSMQWQYSHSSWPVILYWVCYLTSPTTQTLVDFYPGCS